MLKVAGTAIIFALLTSAAIAQDTTSPLQTTVPTGSVTVTKWYKQNVYDSKDAKIGQIIDVLVSDSGQITSLIIGVGGFLKMGEKDVAVTPAAVRTTSKNDKPYLVMDTTKDALKNAPGMKYDKKSMTWAPDTKS